MATLPPLPTISPPAPPIIVGADRPIAMALGAEIKDNTKDYKDPKDPKNMKNKSGQEDSINERKWSYLDMVESAREALVGIPTDFLAQRGTVYEMVTKNNRLRGLGFILVSIALVLALTGILHRCP